jgi:hypothetical protein
MIRDFSGYDLENDHAKLARLARENSVICVVDFDGGQCRDIARTVYSTSDGGEVFQLSARGTGYVYAFGEDDFIEQCKKLNVGFLAPTKERRQ